ncbi:MAG: nitronate monooxygenase [Proteobacteria bacterium]|jgi:nitronate monooxygenase|nr:nitronate monooxygenase [Pseudomonadota bacterium]|tara:strand:- start:3285 stop:4187 length:903 start_codon:yes stop_codon:yes gene_type:complete
MQTSKIIDQLRLPVIVAPMFLVSGPELVIASSNAGLIGSFPGPNARTTEELEQWMQQINASTSNPWAFNMITHKTYDRFDEELELVKQFQPMIVITALGSPERVIEEVHAYGGKVIADVNNINFAKKCAQMNVDGMALICHGAGGHTGNLSPFAFSSYVREFFDGIIVLAGSISTGDHIKAAQLMNTDLCYMGTRFISATESQAVDEYKEMVIQSNYNDLRMTNLFTGAQAYYMKDSIIKNNLDPDNLDSNLDGFNVSASQDKIRAWKDIWSAGQGVGLIKKIESVESIVKELETEFFKG